MALYKYENFLRQSRVAAFDMIYDPGATVVYPGIYRCTSCGDEIAVGSGQRLPELNHRQHYGSVPVCWQLLVYPQLRS